MRNALKIDQIMTTKNFIMYISENKVKLHLYKDMVFNNCEMNHRVFQ